MFGELAQRAKGGFNALLVAFTANAALLLKPAAKASLTIQSGDQDDGNTGTALTVQAGSAGSTGNTVGGSLTLKGGTGNSAGNGGTVLVQGGGTPAGNGGAVTVKGGDATSAARGGDVTIQGGNGAGTSGGAVLIQGGTGTSSASTVTITTADSANPAPVNILSGAGTSFASGAQINVTVGGANNAVGGAIVMTAGAANAGNRNGGNITLDGGAKSGSGTDGNVVLCGARGNAAVGATSPVTSPKLHVNANGTGSNVSNLTGTLLHLSQADSASCLFTMDGYGAIPAIVLRRAQGTAASKSAIGAGNNIGIISGYAYGATGYFGSSVNIAMLAGENWTDTAQGAYLTISTVSNTTTSLAERLRVDHDGQVILQTVGKGISIKEGSNAKMGTATLTAGAATVSTTAVTANSRVFLTSQSDGGTVGFLRVSARSAGTSFTITSSSGSDTSTVAWLIYEPS